MTPAGTHVIESGQAMRDLGARLAHGLRIGDVVALDGDLGAGKTQLVKGIAAALGFAGGVTSPTFTLVHEYAAPGVLLHHIDLYRIESADELARAGIADLLPPPDGITLVEWASKFPHFLPAGSLRIRIAHDPNAADRRLVMIGDVSGD